MRVRWTIPAADDLESIKTYLQQHYPQFAEPTVRSIYQSVLSLKPRRIAAGRATKAARESFRFPRFRTSWCTP